MSTKQLLELKEEEIRLPRQLDLYNQYVQMNHEIKLLRQIPEMKKQLKDMEKESRYIEDRLRVIGAGYDPIIPNRSTFHLGFLQKPPVRSGDELRIYSLYKHALPLPVLEKYIVAKKTGFFKFFSIHSPDPKVFNEVRLYPIDPLLVGWLPDSFYSSWNNYIDGNSEGFLIAQWDMQKDLSAAGLILPQTTKT